MASLFGDVESMDGVEVHVTQDHINKGIPEDAYHCPIACAIGEAYMKHTKAIGGPRVEVTHEGEARMGGCVFKIGREAEEFVTAVDSGELGEVEPFSFILKLRKTDENS